MEHTASAITRAEDTLRDREAARERHLVRQNEVEAVTNFSLPRFFQERRDPGLQRNGDLAIDAPVSDYVPAVRNTAYRDATVRHLLDMRTGVVLDDSQLRDYRAASHWDPVAAGKLVFKYSPAGASTEFHQIYMAKEVVKLLWCGPAKTHGMGDMDPVAYNRTAQLSLRYGLIHKMPSGAYDQSYWTQAIKGLTGAPI